MFFHWSLSDSTSPHVSRTFLSILAELYHAVIWMVSPRPLISRSSCSCINPLVTAPRESITIDIVVSFIFYKFSNSQARSRYLLLFTLSFNFTQWSIRIAIHYFTPWEFSHQLMLMVFHWGLSDNKSPQVSRTLLSIMAVLNNAVVWTVTSRPLISKSSSPCINTLVTVPSAPITVGITVTFMFFSFFDS